jgi:hypothetical protein
MELKEGLHGMLFEEIVKKEVRSQNFKLKTSNSELGT